MFYKRPANLTNLHIVNITHNLHILNRGLGRKH